MHTFFFLLQILRHIFIHSPWHDSLYLDLDLPQSKMDRVLSLFTHSLMERTRDLGSDTLYLYLASLVCFWCFRKFFRTLLRYSGLVSCWEFFIPADDDAQMPSDANCSNGMESSLCIAASGAQRIISDAKMVEQSFLFFLFFPDDGHFHRRRRRNVLNFFTRTAKNFSRSFGRRRHHHHQNRASKSQINQGGKFHPLPRRTSIFILLQYLRTHDDDVIFLGAAACLGILSSLPAFGLAASVTKR